MKKGNTHQLIMGALIAAAYAGLTYLSNVFGLAYGPIQLRLSEILSVLPLFTPAAVPGLTVGCFLANIGSFNMADLLFGTLATCASAYLTYLLRNAKVKGLPLLGLLPPVLVNALVIGFEISVFYLPGTNFLWGLGISALEVGIGQFIVCYALGLPFYFVLKKYKIVSGKE